MFQGADSVFVRIAKEPRAFRPTSQFASLSRNAPIILAPHTAMIAMPGDGRGSHLASLVETNSAERSNTQVFSAKILIQKYYRNRGKWRLRIGTL